MRLTKEEYESLLKRNPKLRPTIKASCNSHTRTLTQSQSTISNESLAKTQVQTGFIGKVHIIFTSFRRRLLDEDNLMPKYHCDLLRYCNIIQGDAPGQAKIEVRQIKVGSKELEEVVIEIRNV